MERTNLLLVDRRDCFVIMNQRRKIKIDYGLYSMMVGSIDFDKVTSIFNTDEFMDIVGTYAEMQSILRYMESNGKVYKNIDKYLLKFETSLYNLYEPLRKCLVTGHLNPQQLSYIVKLFIHEFRFHMSSDSFQWDNAKTYVPSVLSNSLLHDHIQALLKRKTKKLSVELEKDFNNLMLMSNIKLIKGIPYTTYHITNTLDFLLIDLQQFLIAKKTAKECKYCKRLFIPNKRSTALYCRLPHEDNNKTCDYIMHYTPKDDIEKLFTYAKKQQDKFRTYTPNIERYGYKFLETVFSEWKDECIEQYAGARKTNDKDAFDKWIKDTAFKKDTLEKLYQNSLDKL